MIVIYRLLMVVAATSLLSSCTTLENNIESAEQSKIEASAAAAEHRWWEAFGDPLMNQLANEVVKQNLDIQIAAERIAEARGQLRSVNAGFFPDIAASANASRGNRQIGFPEPASIVQGGFDVNWELDVFGQTRSAVNAAQARVKGQLANAEDVTNSVIAELMRALVDYRQAQETLVETNALLAIQDEQVSLFKIRAESGLIDTIGVMRAEAERAQTATRLPLAQAAKDSAQYQIERLMGKESGAMSGLLKNNSATLNVPEVADIIDTSLTVIRNRPDIRAARADLLATKADLMRAEADLWPRISLRGFFGVQDGSSGIPLASNIWSLASGITAPIFNFGRLRGAVDSADARAEAAQLAYENAVLTALQETKTALSDYVNGINAVTEQNEALRHRRDTVALAAERFKSGLTDMTNLTTAQSELNQATLLLIERKASAATAYIRLKKALGTAPG